MFPIHLDAINVKYLATMKISVAGRPTPKIDLSFYHPSLYLDYNWSVCEDRHNSDHFPIIIEQNTFSTEDHIPKWK